MSQNNVDHVLLLSWMNSYQSFLIQSICNQSSPKFATMDSGIWKVMSSILVLCRQRQEAVLLFQREELDEFFKLENKFAFLCCLTPLQSRSKPQKPGTNCLNVVTIVSQSLRPQVWLGGELLQVKQSLLWAPIKGVIQILIQRCTTSLPVGLTPQKLATN